MRDFTKRFKAWLGRTLSAPHSRVVAFVLLFAVIGSIALLLTRAATSSGNTLLEAENGTGSGVTRPNDPNASGGSYLKFGSGGSGFADVANPPDTNYDPAGGIFVAASGSDTTGTGTIDKPYQTLTFAVSKAAVGSKIVLRQGVYNETVPAINKRLTIQNYPHETVWLSGSKSFSGWIQASSAGHQVWSKQISTQLCETTSDQTPVGTPAAACQDNSLVDGGSDPLAERTEMLFVNGVQLKQVSKSTFDANPNGSFVADNSTTPTTYYVGSNPAGSSVEVTNLRGALRFVSGASGSVLRGIGFRNYGSDSTFNSSFGVMASVSFSVPNFTIENDVFANSASRGIALGGGHAGTGISITGSSFVNNAYQGGNGTALQDFEIAHNLFKNNNTLGFISHNSHRAAAAGFKMSNADNGDIHDNIFDGNNSTALWCETGCVFMSYYRNVFFNNAWHGLYHETSGQAIIASNLSYKNKQYGIYVEGSRNVQVYNNTMSRNGADLAVIADQRGYPPTGCSVLHLKGLSAPKDVNYYYGHANCQLADITIENNVLSNNYNNSAGNPLILTDQITNADNYISGLDYNLYHRDDATKPVNLVSWYRTTGSIGLKKLSDIQAFKPWPSQIDLETHGAEDARTIFTNEAGGDYSISTAYNGNGNVLPPEIAQLLGLSSTRVRFGILPGAYH